MNAPLTEQDCKDYFLDEGYKKVQSAKRLLKQELVRYHLLDRHIIELIDACFYIPDDNQEAANKVEATKPQHTSTLSGRGGEAVVRCKSSRAISTPPRKSLNTIKKGDDKE
jgi:hypothetical protein